MTKSRFRIIIGTVALIVAYILIQQGPLLLSKFTQYPIEFIAESPRKFVADLSKLPSGKYFVSVGRTLGDAEIYFNDVLLQRGQLTAGVPVELTDAPVPKKVSIVWLAREEWRKRLYDQPIITGYGAGFLIQEWRKFVAVFMGPLSSLALILFALFNHRVAKGGTSSIFPHLMCGISGFTYGLFLAGIPDLFLSFAINLPYQVGLRFVLSGAIMYLISTYAKKRYKTLIWMHIAGAALLIPLSFVSRDWIIVLYKVGMIFFTIATIIPTIALMRLRDWNSEIELMICLGLSLTILESFSAVAYILWGPSSLTVWSPSFIAALAISNFYFIYKKAVTHSIEVQLSKRQYDLAAQIAHDIRSPLAALNAIVQSSEGVGQSAKDQIKSVVARIRDIANNLLCSDPLADLASLGKEIRVQNVIDGSFNGLLSEINESQLISQRLSSIVSEKRHQYSRRKGVEILFNETGLNQPCFVNVQPVEFGRVLSNLIDNAVQAISEKGKVTVDLRGDESQVQIFIEDTGIGMSSDVLGKIGTRGYSYGRDGKQQGSGLGVYHALESVGSWNGSLKYVSEVGRGTRAIVTIPRAQPPDWFLDKIYINEGATVILLDDDQDVHRLWREKLSVLVGARLRIISFCCSNDLIKWYRDALGIADQCVFLCDLELASSDCSGLDVIEMLGVASNAILLTNAWDDPRVRNRCKKIGVKILPKSTTFSICVREISPA